MGRRRKSQEEEYVKDEEPRTESIDGERGRRLMRRLHRYVHGEEDEERGFDEVVLQTRTRRRI